jgi:hypothetical protein
MATQVGTQVARNTTIRGMLRSSGLGLRYTKCGVVLTTEAQAAKYGRMPKKAFEIKGRSQQKTVVVVRVRGLPRRFSFFYLDSEVTGRQGHDVR